MVDSLMTSSENFLRHKSFSSKEGGFKIIINGLSVFTTNVTLDYNYYDSSIQSTGCYCSRCLGITSTRCRIWRRSSGTGPRRTTTRVTPPRTASTPWCSSRAGGRSSACPMASVNLGGMVKHNVEQYFCSRAGNEGPLSFHHHRGGP